MGWCIKPLVGHANVVGECISSLPITNNFRALESIILPASARLLISDRYSATFTSLEEIERISKLTDIPHATILAHGDLHRHDILVEDNHLSGIVNCECVGRLPDY